MRKTYRSATKLTFPLKLKGGKRHVKFEEQFYGYSTSDEEEQSAIEGSPHFGRGEIKLFKSVAEEGDKAPKKVVADPPVPAKKPIVNPPVPLPSKDGSTGKGEEYLDEVDLNKFDRLQLLDFIKLNDVDVVVTDEMSEEDIRSAIATALEDDKAEGFTDFPNVTDINGAVEVLKVEPYKVAHQSLRTPSAIMNKATENKVTFSNWKVE